MLRSLRPLLFWTHLALGAIAGLVILVMSATGVLLTYQKQITAYADSQTHAEVGADWVTADSIIAAAARYAPNVKPASLLIRPAPDAPVAVGLGRGRTLLVNPYTGVPIAEASPGVRKAFGMITDAHRWLAMKDANRDTARKITGAANLAFLFLVVSGLFLWLPRVWRWSNVRAVLWFKGKQSAKARDFNWHHVFGIWFALPLLLVVASGVVISYPWASRLVYRAVGETPPAAPAPPTMSAAPAPPTMSASPHVSIPVDSLVAIARAHAMRVAPAWRTISVPIGEPKSTRVSITIDEGTGGQPQLRQTLVLDRTNGTVVSAETFGEQTRGRRLRSFMRFAHTGEFGGIPGQTIAGLASLAGVVLVYTGLALSLRRLRHSVRLRLRSVSKPSG